MSEIREGYTRISEILAPFTRFDEVPEDILERACIRGTEVHKYCDAIINGMGTPKIKPEWQGYVDSFMKWYPGKMFVDKPERFYCDEYMITGEIDGLYRYRDHFVLVDFKTSTCESKTWRVQAEAYYHLATKAGITISRMEFIKLDKTGKDPTVYLYEADDTLFLECLKLYNLFFRGKSKKKNAQAES